MLNLYPPEKRIIEKKKRKMENISVTVHVTAAGARGTEPWYTKTLPVRNDVPPRGRLPLTPGFVYPMLC